MRMMMRRKYGSMTGLMTGYDNTTNEYRRKTHGVGLPLQRDQVAVNQPAHLKQHAIHSAAQPFSLALSH